MHKLKLFLAFLFAGLLIGCSNGGSGSDRRSGDIIPSASSASSSSSSTSSTSSGGIANTALPVYEDFGNGDFTNFDQADTIAFFSDNYRALATANAADTLPAFFYPTAAFFGAGEPLQDRLAIANAGGGEPALLISNARFTVGQTLPGFEVADPKTSTTSASDTESWGELDLSKDYRISFCVVSASGSGAFQVYLDNNTGGTAAASMHGSSSRLFTIGANSLVAGERVEINVPGEARVQPGGTVVSVIATLRGTENSFLQFRQASGGATVIDDLLIEYQSDVGNNPVPPCDAAPASPPPVPAAPVLTAGDTQISVSWPAVGFPFATGYDVIYNTVNSITGATAFAGNPVSGTSATITGLSNGVTYFVFVRSRNGNGESAYSPGSSATPAAPVVPPAVPQAPSLTPGDMEIDVSITAVPGATGYDIIYNTVDNTSGATAFSGNPVSGTSATITGLVNDTPYFVFVRAKNSAGNSAYSPSASATPSATPSTTAIPFTEDFSAADQAEYFSAAYKALSDDASAPLNNVTAGGSNITVSGGALSFNNARFSIGDKDPGTATTAGTQHPGDFDLSRPYTITFDVITNENAAGNFFVYVDNNTTSSGASVHSTIGSTASRIFQKSAATLADGDTATGTVTINSSVGTATSFIQIRTDSGVTSPITIDNLTITYQPVVTALPFTEDFSAADQAGYFSAAYKALSDDPDAPLNNVTAGGSNITVSGGALSFNNARFSIGDKDPGTATTAGTQHAGDFDLSQPYTITFDVITNENAAGNFFVYVDNNTTSSGASVHSTIGSTASRIFQKSAATLADGDTATGTVTINSSVGTATSFIQIRTDSGVTSPITIDNLVIDYQ